MKRDGNKSYVFSTSTKKSVSKYKSDMKLNNKNLKVHKQCISSLYNEICVKLPNTNVKVDSKEKEKINSFYENYYSESMDNFDFKKY